jgi:hypothetical protein
MQSHATANASSSLPQLLPIRPGFAVFHGNNTRYRQTEVLNASAQR